MEKNFFADFPALHVQAGKGRAPRLYVNWPPELSGTGKRCREYFGPADDPASRARYADAREKWLDAKRAGASKLVTLPPEPAEQTPQDDEDDGEPVGLVTNLIDRYLVHTRQRYQKHGKPTGTHRHIWITLKPFLIKYGEMETAKFGLDELEEYQQELDKAGKLCRNKINARIRIIVAMFVWGARHEGEDGQRLVPPPAAAELKLIENLRRGYCRAIDHPRRGAVLLEDLRKTIPELSRPVAAMVQVQLLTGARPNEIREMKAREITRSAADVWEYRPESYKTEHLESRDEGRKVIFLGPRAIAVLEPFLDAAEKAGEKAICSARWTQPGNAGKYRRPGRRPRHAPPGTR